jgi:hypothetical protein
MNILLDLNSIKKQVKIKQNSLTRYTSTCEVYFLLFTPEEGHKEGFLSWTNLINKIMLIIQSDPFDKPLFTIWYKVRYFILCDFSFYLFEHI